MNHSLTPVSELERRLSALIESCGSLPPVIGVKTRERSLESHLPLNSVLSSFESQLEGLRLEASLLQSEDSPFTRRRRQREQERAQRLEEARVFAEAQIERRYREKELEELRAQRAEAEAKAREERAFSHLHAAQESEHSAQVFEASISPSSSEDWDPSIEYTMMRTEELSHLVPQEKSGLTITPDDSIFADLPSAPPQILSSLQALKDSLPPRRSAQVTAPPKAQALTTTSSKTDQQQLISLLKGLLPVKPRSKELAQAFIGGGWSSESYAVSSAFLPWEELNEIVWREMNEAKILEELEGLTSLSLAPRAFSPAQPQAKRTISLRLKSTDTPIAPQSPIEEEFNLSDFEETRDPELQEMHETYRALEAQVAEFNFEGDAHQLASLGVIEPSLDPPREHLVVDDDDDDEGTDFTTLDPDLPLISDPFALLDDLDIGDERRGGEFDWEGDTPTNIFGDEPTPTNIYGEESQEGEQAQPDDGDPHQTNSRGLFSRFFGRK